MAQELQMYDKDLEELVIISLLKGQESVKDYLLGSTKEELFFAPWWKEVYHRIKNLVREKNKVPNEVDILHDPVIADNTKAVIRGSQFFTQDNYIKDFERCKSAVEQLTQFSKARKLHGIHTQLGEYITKGENDLKKIVHNVSAKLYEINTDSENFESSIFRLTDTESSDKLVNDILGERTARYIPTGFDQFDGVNKGLPRGGLTLVMAQTGAGKSLAALSMARAQAEAGFKVCLVSLEMNEFELTERRFSSVTGIPLAQLKDATALTVQERDKAVSTFKAYRERISKAGGREDYKCRSNNLTAEELLYGLKPFAYDVIIIDYLGLLKGVDGDDQWRKLSEAARFCKIFAEDNEMNIIALAQLSKDNEIRYSKGVLEHANNSFSWLFGKKEAETHIVEVEQKKARMSQRFNFYMKLDFATMTMRDLDPAARELHIQQQSQEQARGEGFTKKAYGSKKTSFFGD